MSNNVMIIGIAGGTGSGIPHLPTGCAMPSLMM